MTKHNQKAIFWSQSGFIQGFTTKKRQIKVLSTGRFSQGGGFTYFDTSETGGIAIEIIQWPRKQ